jgi:hypothetical protein
LGDQTCENEALEAISEATSTKQDEEHSILEAQHLTKMAAEEALHMS